VRIAFLLCPALCYLSIGSIITCLFGANTGGAQGPDRG
jgi:hypothetical protein